MMDTTAIMQPSKNTTFQSTATTAGAVGGTDTWMRVTTMPEERIMDWDDIRSLMDAGMTIGSHTMTHSQLSVSEVKESRDVLGEKLGISIDHFAYPRGEVPSGGVGWVRDAGYSAGWATKGGDENRFSRRRLPVSANANLGHFGSRLLKAKLGYY